MTIIKSILFTSLLALFTACLGLPEDINEGTVENPVSIPLNTNHYTTLDSADSDNAVSYYKFTTEDEGYYIISAKGYERSIDTERQTLDDIVGIAVSVDGTANHQYINSGSGSVVIYLEKQTTYYFYTYAYYAKYYLNIQSATENKADVQSPVNLTTNETTSISTENGISYYTFDINASSYYSITANNLFSIASLYLGLDKNDFNETSNNFWKDRYVYKYKNNYAPINSFLEEGKYYLSIINFDNYGDFDLTIEPLAYEGLEKSPVQITLDNTYNANIAYKDSSYYVFEAPTDGNYSIITDDYSHLSNLTLKISTDRDWIYQTTSYNDKNKSIQVRLLKGIYDISAKNMYDSGGNTNFNLTVSLNNTIEIFNEGSLSSPLELKLNQTHNGSALTKSFYKFNINSAGEYIIGLSRTVSNTWTASYLYSDPSYNEEFYIASSYHHVYRSLEPGTYYLSVYTLPSSFNDDGSVFDLIIRERK